MYTAEQLFFTNSALSMISIPRSAHPSYLNHAAVTLTLSFHTCYASILCSPLAAYVCPGFKSLALMPSLSRTFLVMYTTLAGFALPEKPSVCDERIVDNDRRDFGGRVDVVPNALCFKDAVCVVPLC